MNTLYINIIGEDIQSTENNTVIGKPRNAIINEFYSELVNGIIEGVNHPNIDVERRKSLVTDFEANNKVAFAKIPEQWEIVKKVLLGEKPVGTYNVILPQEYVNWLYNHSKDVYNKIATCLAKRNNTVEISIEAIYKEAVGFLNNIDLSKKYDQLVVNDDAVNVKSQILVDIYRKIGETVPFIMFSDWTREQDLKKCPKCEKSPCECEKLPPPTLCDSIYAIKFYDGEGCFKRNERYRFYGSDGQRLTDDEYYIIAKGENSKMDHSLRHLLVMKTNDDSSLFYLTLNGEFVRIGDYDRQKDYDVTIVQEGKYILYRNNRHYKLFKIGESIELVSEFSSKVKFGFRSSVVENYIIEEFEGTLNLTTGDIVDIDDYVYPYLIGFVDNEPVFLAEKGNDDNDEYVINMQGDILWRSCYKDITPLYSSNLLLVMDSNGKKGIVTPSGKAVLSCQYRRIRQINDDECVISSDDFEYGTKLFILSKQMWADDDLSVGDYIVDYVDGITRVFSKDTYELVFSEKMTKREYEHFGIHGDFVVNKKDELYSLKAGKVVHKFISDNPWSYSSEVFVVFNDGSFELFDHCGKLLQTIEHDSCYENPHLWDNGYVSFIDNKRHKCMFYDSEMIQHIVENKDIKPNDGFGLRFVDITSNYIIIEGERQYILNSNHETVFQGCCLTKIDKEHYYGSKCTGVEDDWCIIDAESGIVPVSGKRGDMYLVH